MAVVGTPETAEDCNKGVSFLHVRDILTLEVCLARLVFFSAPVYCQGIRRTRYNTGALTFLAFILHF